MKFSESWLRELVSPKVSSEELASQLSLAGLEVGSVEPAAPEFTGVVVGHVLDKKQHPDADRLSVCQVDIGQGEPVQIVCGAKNVEANMKVPVATVGAILPGDFKIKKSKLRGEASHGMICSETELGLAESSDGIMPLAADAPVGNDIRQYFNLNDHCIDVELTPNRGDCLSIVGMAREVGVVNQYDVAMPNIPNVTEQSQQAHQAKVLDDGACPVYLTRVIEGVDNTVETPFEITEKLRRSGIRAINPVVDVLNYVMLLLGQPMHAFDREKLIGDIQVRFAKAGEQITLLNDQETELKDNTLIIADQNNPIAIAGVMGSLESGVTEITKTIVLESAFFTPTHIAGKARQYGLHTDASHRFERGVDPTLPEQSMALATQLLLDLVGGKAGPVSKQTSEKHVYKPITVDLNITHVERLLGITVSGDQIKQTLSALGLVLSQENNGMMSWQVPSWRFDIAIEADLIEEIARVIGYDNIPNTMPNMASGQLTREHVSLTQKARDLLTAQGFYEAVTYSFGELKQQSLFVAKDRVGADPCIGSLHQLQNPISPELAVMRSSLIPGLLNAASYNLKRQQDRVRLFETGHCFFPAEKGADTVACEYQYLAGVACGDVSPLSWHKAKNNAADFYQMKGIVEQLLASIVDKGQISFVPCQGVDWLHPGQSANIVIAGKHIGYLGILHPGVQKAFKLKQPVSLFELNLDALPMKEKPAYQALSKFPSVRRDIAIELAQAVSSAEVVNTIQAASNAFLQNVTVFDVYQGDKIAQGKKSMALALTFQAFERTLEDQEIHAGVEKIIKALHDAHAAELRE